MNTKLKKAISDKLTSFSGKTFSDSDEVRDYIQVMLLDIADQAFNAGLERGVEELMGKAEEKLKSLKESDNVTWQAIKWDDLFIIYEAILNEKK